MFEFNEQWEKKKKKKKKTQLLFHSASSSKLEMKEVSSNSPNTQLQKRASLIADINNTTNTIERNATQQRVNARIKGRSL